jgi:rare lipoprotein A
MVARVPVAALLVTGLLACGAHRDQVAPPRELPREAIASTAVAEPRSEVQVGDATWYGGRLAGHRTANGERFDPRQMTAAHRTLPLGTWVEVTRIDTGQRVRVRINDRGPFGHRKRVIDLSRAAAEALDMRRVGVARVEIRVVRGP